MTLSIIGQSLSIAGDGSGTMTVSPTVVSASSSGNQLTFTFTAAETMSGGAIRLTVPNDWSPPQGTLGVAGYTIVFTLTGLINPPIFAGMTVTVPIVSLAPNQTVRIVYGSGSGSSGAVVQPNPGAAMFLTESRITGAGTLTPIANSPTVIVTGAPDGSGTMTVSPTVVSTGSSGNQLTFIFTPAGPMDGGAIRLTIPSGWSPPQATSGVAGYTTVSSTGVIGAPVFAGMTVTVPIVSLTAGQTITITYGAGSGSSGAVAQSSAGNATFLTQSRGSASGSLVEIISGSPVVQVVDGAGTITLVDENPLLTWNYLLTHNSGSVPQWTYTGAAITGANVDGAAAAAGWSVLLQTATQVVFTTTTPLASGSLTGFHITGTAGGMGTWTAGSNSGSVEGSLPVRLSSFTATRNSNGVLISWRTETETNNLGFNIYRVESQKEVKINPQMIRGHGTTGSPHSYEFLDLDAPEGNVKYFIEDIDFEGNRQRSKIIRVIDPKGQMTTTWGKIKSKY